ncbi:MAG: MFS transporter [Pseudomonadota bacterium]
MVHDSGTTLSDDAALKRSALIVAVVSSFLTPFMISSVNIALPAMARDLDMDAVTTSWVATAYLLTAAVCLVPAGRWADIHGRKRVFLQGIVLFTAAALISGLARSSAMMIAARCLQGAGSAMIFGTSIAILSSVYPPHERGRVLGIAVAAVYMGLSLGPFAGGVITHHVGWRWLFFAAVPAGVFVIALAVIMLRGEWAGAAGESFDIPGTLLYAVGLTALLGGMTTLPSRVGMASSTVGMVTLAWFFAWAARRPSPVLDIALFRHNRVFAFSCMAALIHYGATFAVTFLLSLYLQHIRHLTAQAAGMVLVAQPIMMALFSPMAGKLSDRVEPRYIASFGMAITAMGLVLLAGVDAATPTWGVLGTLMLMGFGFALFSSPNMNAIMGAVAPRFYGTASGMVGTMRLLGQVLSMAVATLLFSLIIGPRALTPEVYPELLRSITIALWLFAGLCTLGIGFSMFRGRLRELAP